MRYWFCITTPPNYEKVKQHMLWRAEERYQTTMKRLTLDDIFVIYVTNPAKAIAGIFKVATLCYFDETPLGWGKIYPYRVKIQPVTVPPIPIPMEEGLMEELIFITDKSKKGRPVFFFPAMVLITEEDYLTVRRWLDKKMS